MPSAYAHYRFGRQVLERLPGELAAPLRAHRPLYDIGLHGPDILFYYEPLHACPVNRLGYAIHDEPGAAFFGPAQQAAAAAPRPEAALAYLAGFLCHYALDSQCHPYINAVTSHTALTHSHLETELDAVLMAQDGLDPVRHVPNRHILPTAENAACIAPFFPGVTPAQVRKALRGMRRVLGLLSAPTAAKRQLIYTALRLAGQYDALGGLVVTPRRDPACAAPLARLQTLYDEALPLAQTLITEYAAGLPACAPQPDYYKHPFG